MMSTLKLYKFMIAVAIISLFNISYAATDYHGDSVMSPGGFSTAPLVLSGQSKTTGNQYTSSIVTEYQTGYCPAGLTTNTGSATYNSAQRTITTIYLGTQLVSTTVGSWIDSDVDCYGYINTVGACPAGYSGTITYQEKIGTTTGGYVEGGWYQIANSCVFIPVSETRYNVDGSGAYIDGIVTFNFFGVAGTVLFFWDGQIVGSYINDPYLGNPVGPGTYNIVAGGYSYTNGALMAHTSSPFGDQNSGYQITRTPL